MSVVGDVVSGSIKVARLPLDVANRVLGRSGLEVDEADARVREAAGTLAGDSALKAQGTRKKTATAQRKRAARLRSDADTRDAAAAQAASDAGENLDELTKRERLSQLRDASDALGEQRDAQTASDEADRLGDSAARVKQARKSRA